MRSYAGLKRDEGLWIEDMNDMVRPSPTEMWLLDKSEVLQLKNAAHWDCCERNLEVIIELRDDLVDIRM